MVDEVSQSPVLPGRDAQATCDTLPPQLQHAIESDRRWREHLRALPVEAKIQIIIEMQRWAQAIRSAAGKPSRPVWEERK